MLTVGLKTLPFFAVIGLGYYAGHKRFFAEVATAALTKFVFYFALSAMLFRFASDISLSEVFDGPFVLAYLLGTGVVYGIATAVALWRQDSIAEAAIEAQCAVIGNVGFLGIPMLVLLLGPQAIGPILLVQATDLIVFGSLIVILITASRGGALGLPMLWTLVLSLLKNPMIMSISAGLCWSALSWPVPGVFKEFLVILGGAATPRALFAIGAALAFKSAERIEVAAWLSFCKLVLHPASVAYVALGLFAIDTSSAGVMVAAAALPVAGNVYILAQHYEVAAQRVSASILISTMISIITISAVIFWLETSLSAG
ncbi:MAG: AEC family transporter [Paracoccaceae bacterium]|nr:AEC family transporter [Paracoccaceae bacterium]